MSGIRLVPIVSTEFSRELSNDSSGVYLERVALPPHRGTQEAEAAFIALTETLPSVLKCALVTLAGAIKSKSKPWLSQKEVASLLWHLNS